MSQSTGLVFGVLAGSYDDNEPNCKYCDEFTCLEAAIAEYKKHSTRAWVCVLCGDLTLIGYNPLMNDVHPDDYETPETDDGYDMDRYY